MQKMLLKAWTERSCVVHVSEWKCQQVSPGKGVAVPAGASLTPMIGATSVGTGATTPTTATASAREAVAAGLVLDPAQGPDHEDAAIALALVAVATAGAVAVLLPTPDAGAGLVLQHGPNPGLQREAAQGPALGLDLHPEDAPFPDPVHDLRQPTTRGTVVPDQQVQPEAQRLQMTERSPPSPPSQTDRPSPLHPVCVHSPAGFVLVYLVPNFLSPISPEGCSLHASSDCCRCSRCGRQKSVSI